LFGGHNHPFFFDKFKWSMPCDLRLKL